MIFDAMEQATQSLESYAEAQSNHQLYSRYASAMKNLDTPIAVLAHTLEMVEIIGQQGWVADFGIRSDIASSLLGALHTLRENCVHVVQLTQDNVKVLEQATAMLNTDITQQWVRLAKEHAGSLSASLTMVTGIIENPSLARGYRDALELGFKDLPKSRNDVIKFTSSAAHGQAMIEQLKVDAQTQAFLIKLTAGRATLSDINDHILNWIQEQKLENKLSVGFISNRQ
jgi:hypothetical protein